MEAVGSFFGIELKRQIDTRDLPAFAPRTEDDGAVVAPAGANFGTYVDFDGTIRTEAEVVSKYRDMSLHPEIDNAIDNIVNEAIVVSDEDETVEIILDDLKVSAKSIKKHIEIAFAEVVRLLEFNNKSYEIFKRWYVDGRLYYEVIIDEKRLDEGIKELRYLDPRKIRKIREVSKRRDPDNPGITVPKVVAEYYLYSERALATRGRDLMPQTTSIGLKIAKDSVLHATSGLTDTHATMVLGYMHKAIRGLNQLRSLEDAVVIYRLSRAPERRIFYVDVGSLPKIKAEQHMKDMMQKHRNKLLYDLQTGEIRDDRRFMTMIEDYWIARREGGKSTEVVTLPAGQQLGEMGDVDYFKRKLYESLNVPMSRLDPESIYNVGRSTQISRDEVNFSKFIDRLRLKFSNLFIQALEKQLVLKKILSPDEWDEISQDIKFRFLRDNYFSELKEGEIQMDRFARLEQSAMYAGKYISHEWIRKKILMQTDEEMAIEDSRIAAEVSIEQYMDMDPMGMDQGGFGNDPMGGELMPPAKKPPPKLGGKKPPGKMNGSNGSENGRQGSLGANRESVEYIAEEDSIDKELKETVIAYLKKE